MKKMQTNAYSYSDYLHDAIEMLDREVRDLLAKISAQSLKEKDRHDYIKKTIEKLMREL